MKKQAKNKKTIIIVFVSLLSSNLFIAYAERTPKVSTNQAQTAQPLYPAQPSIPEYYEKEQNKFAEDFIEYAEHTPKLSAIRTQTAQALHSTKSSIPGYYKKQRHKLVENLIAYAKHKPKVSTNQAQTVQPLYPAQPSIPEYYKKPQDELADRHVFTYSDLEFSGSVQVKDDVFKLLNLQPEQPNTVNVTIRQNGGSVNLYFKKSEEDPALIQNKTS